jgi:hypothetical protein
MSRVDDNYEDDDQAFLRRKTEEVAIELSDIARVPAKHRERFCKMMTPVLRSAYYWCEDLQRPRLMEEVGMGAENNFRDLEKAVWRLDKALQALTKEQYLVFEVTGMSLHSGEEIKDGKQMTLSDWRAEVRDMLTACSIITGKNPYREAMGGPGKQRGGRHRGDVQNWPLHRFVCTLWKYARDCDGDLRASCKNNVGSGTMFTALNRLQDYFPKTGFIKPVLPDQTIANIVTSMREAVPK